MTQHLLQGRTEKEVLWFQRRDTLKAAHCHPGGSGTLGY